jgi:sulfate permease, SulP family
MLRLQVLSLGPQNGRLTAPRMNADMNADTPARADTLRRWLPFLAWPSIFHRFIKQDIFAGLTLGLMILPQGVAYAALAGMPLVTGVYASLLPALVAVLWGASTRVSVGPAALTCLLVSSSLTGMAEPGSTQWVLLAVWLALMSGALQLLLGLGRFGWLLNLVTSPVLTGFTQAAALLILASQLPTLLGLEGSIASLVAQAWAGNALPMNLKAAAFGIGSLAMLLLGKRLWPNFPVMITVVAAAAGTSAWLGFEQGGGPVVGTLPAGLPSLYWPQLPPLQTLSTLVMPALIIALISFLETASSAKVENQADNKRWNDNQDLIGQGLAKITSALCGSFPTSSSFSRSAILMHAGARTGWATVASVALVLVALVALMPALHPVPKSVLAAVVIAAVVGLVKPAEFVRLWRVSPTEAITSAVTFLLTLATAPRLYWGVLAGMLMSLSHFLHHRLHPRIIEVGLHSDGSLRDRHLWKLPLIGPAVYALRMDAELDFASASGLANAVGQHLNAYPSTRHVCLFAQPINRIDVTGVEAFTQIRTSLAERGISLHISGIKLPVETILRRANALPEGPLLRMYRTDSEALVALRSL